MIFESVFDKARRYESGFLIDAYPWNSGNALKWNNLDLDDPLPPN